MLFYADATARAHLSCWDLDTAFGLRSALRADAVDGAFVVDLVCGRIERVESFGKLLEPGWSPSRALQKAITSHCVRHGLTPLLGRSRGKRSMEQTLQDLQRATLR